MLAQRLESEIRAGASREKTREIYTRLRTRRMGLIGLGLEGDIGVSKADMAAVEQMMAELAAYYERLGRLEQ